MCSLLCFGRKNSRGADLRDKTYTLCPPLKPSDLAPTPCGLFSRRASLGLTPPAPQTSQVVAGPSATSVKAGSATPYLSTVQTPLLTEALSGNPSAVQTLPSH